MWRSVLFIPVLQERFLAKAAHRGADAIVLDLEASIPFDQKEAARTALPDAIDRLDDQGQDVLVRINMLWRAALSDLEQAARPGVRAVVLPDCKVPGDITAVDAVLAEIEAERGLEPIAVIPLIESARGLVNAPAIASAAPRVTALAFGIEDYLTDMQAAHDSAVLMGAAQSIAHAARAAGKTPMVVPTTLADIQNIAAFESAALRGKAMGSTGGFAVHPDQVAILNKVFRPSPEELAWATRVTSAAKEAKTNGDGVFTLDGRMIDLPIIQRAQNLLRRATGLAE